MSHPDGVTQDAPCAPHHANVLHLAAAVAAKENTDAGALVTEVIAKKSRELSRELAKNQTETRSAKRIAADLLAHPGLASLMNHPTGPAIPPHQVDHKTCL